MRRRLMLAALTCSLALAACAGGPPPRIATPVAELPESYFALPEGVAEGSLASLMPLDDPAYAALSAAALQNAPTLAQALARVESARAGARSARAARMPNMDAETFARRNRINPAQFGEAGEAGIIPNELTSYGANIIASWDPDLFGQLKAQQRAAAARIDAASAEAQAVRIALLAEIAASVTDWRVLAEQRAAIESDVSAAKALAGLAGSREQSGIAPGFDRVRAEAAASASATRLAALDSEKARIIGRLVTLTGQDAASIATSLASGNASTLTARPAPTSLPSDLLANRPDVAAAAALLAASDADLAATARARFPRLTLSGVIGLLAFDLDRMFDENSLVGTLAASIAGPLIDFGRVGARIDGAAADKKAAFAAYRGAVFQALGDAEAAYGLVAASDSEAALAVTERDQLTRAVSLAETRYKAGLASFLDVLEARRAADTSGERAAAALGRAARARIVLWQALGGEPRPSALALNQR
jgi:NodT family efflux transporter outer membrane factor (OMF) lipoprotein